MRLKEMVSMGVGNKPFLDIQPSDAAISDRAVHYIMKSRGNTAAVFIYLSVSVTGDVFINIKWNQMISICYVLICTCTCCGGEAVLL